MPIGIIGSLVVCTVLYILFGQVLTGMMPYRNSWGRGAGCDCDLAMFPYVVAADSDDVRHHRRLYVGDSGDAAGTIPRVLFDVARSACSPRSSPTFTRNFRRLGAATCSSWFSSSLFSASCRSPGGPHDQYRHAVGLRHRVHRDHHHAEDESERAAAVPDAAGAPGADPGRARLLCDDGLAGCGHVDPASGLAGHGLAIFFGYSRHHSHLHLDQSKR